MFRVRILLPLSLILAGFLVIGRRIVPLVATAWRPGLLAFSTASSEAAYPRLLDGLQAFGVHRNECLVRLEGPKVCFGSLIEGQGQKRQLVKPIVFLDHSPKILD